MAPVRAEKWLSVADYAGYEISDLGRVRSWRCPGKNRFSRRRKPYIRKLIPNDPKGGYLAVMLCPGGKRKKKLKQVHVLVLEAFVGARPEGWETRHLDGDVINNRLSNLAWGDRPSQLEDQRRHGTLGRRLTRSRAEEIRRRSAAGTSDDDLALEFNVGFATIVRIRRGRMWRPKTRRS